MCGFGAKQGASGNGPSRSQKKKEIKRKGDFKVLITFSSVSMSTFSDWMDEKFTSTAQPYTSTYPVTNLAWSQPKGPGYKGSFDETVFVDCSSDQGNFYKSLSPSELSLMEYVGFAISRLNLYSKRRSDDGLYGTIHCTICAYHPCEKLLFALSELMGNSLAYSSVYSSFVSLILGTEVFRLSLRTIQSRGWKIKVDYCGVFDPYEAQGKDKKGDAQRAKEMKDILHDMPPSRTAYNMINSMNADPLLGYSPERAFDYDEDCHKWADKDPEHRKYEKGERSIVYEGKKYTPDQFEAEYNHLVDPPLEEMEANLKKIEESSAAKKKKINNRQKTIQASKDEYQEYRQSEIEVMEIQNLLDNSPKYKAGASDKDLRWIEARNDLQFAGLIRKDDSKYVLDGKSTQGWLLDWESRDLAKQKAQADKDVEDYKKAIADKKEKIISQRVAGVQILIAIGSIFFPPLAILDISITVCEWIRKDSTTTGEKVMNGVGIAFDVVGLIPYFGKVFQMGKYFQEIGASSSEMAELWKLNAALDREIDDMSNILLDAAMKKTNPLSDSALAKQIDDAVLAKQIDDASSLAKTRNSSLMNEVDGMADNILSKPPIEKNPMSSSDAALSKQIDDAVLSKQIDDASSLAKTRNSSLMSEVDGMADDMLSKQPIETKPMSSSDAALSKQIDDAVLSKQIDDAVAARQASDAKKNASLMNEVEGMADDLFSKMPEPNVPISPKDAALSREIDDAIRANKEIEDGIDAGFGLVRDAEAANNEIDAAIEAGFKFVQDVKNENAINALAKELDLTLEVEYKASSLKALFLTSADKIIELTDSLGVTVASNIWLYTICIGWNGFAWLKGENTPVTPPLSPSEKAMQQQKVDAALEILDANRAVADAQTALQNATTESEKLHAQIELKQAEARQKEALAFQNMRYDSAPDPEVPQKEKINAKAELDQATKDKKAAEAALAKAKTPEQKQAAWAAKENAEKRMQAAQEAVDAQEAADFFHNEVDPSRADVTMNAWEQSSINVENIQGRTTVLANNQGLANTLDGLNAGVDPLTAMLNSEQTRQLNQQYQAAAMAAQLNNGIPYTDNELALAQHQENEKYQEAQEAGEDAYQSWMAEIDVDIANAELEHALGKDNPFADPSPFDNK